MNDDQRIRLHFDELIDRDAAARQEMLEKIRQESPSIASRVHRLLLLADRVGDALDHTPSLPSVQADDTANRSRGNAPVTTAPSSDGLEGECIGAYVVYERIGAGGFGEVYRAQRPDLYDREVAIKVLRPGMDSRSIVERFRREMESLARMDSPHIAAVTEAGALPSGRPYFVMEFIKGKHITRFADEQRLSIRERLQLFLQVCEAIQHAHHKGVFHRDIKPSNVLVSNRDGRPFAQVIDFGIAKATSQRDGEAAPEATIEGQPIGTIGYMSPEQIEGSADIDARTDVYSLGVLLYELLTGTTPLERAGLRHASFVAIRQHVREHAAPRPGTLLRANDPVLAPIALARSTAPTRLIAALRGDLDWILVKALDPDRERRYSSVSEFGADIERHLREEPVTAGPPSRAYRVRKFVRRYRAYVIGVALAIVGLNIGLMGTAIGLQRARAAERVAKQRLADAEFIAAFQRRMLESMNTEASGRELVDDILARCDEALAASGVDDASRRARLTSLRRDLALLNATDVASGMVDRAIVSPAIAALDAYDMEPTIAIRLRRTLGLAYAQLGRLPTSIALLERALDESLRVNGPEHIETMAIRDLLAVQYRDVGDVERGEAILRTSLDVRTRLQGVLHPDRLKAMLLLATIHHQRREFAEASAAAEESVRGLRDALGVSDAATIDALRWAGETAMAEGRLKEAEQFFREGLEAVDSHLDAQHPMALLLQGAIASLYMRQGRYAEVAEPMQSALEGFRRTLGDDHPTTLRYILNLGAVYSVIGRPEEAEKLLREALDRLTDLRGADHPDVITAASNLARSLQVQGRLAEAFPYHEQAYQRGRIVLGADDPRVLSMGGNLGVALLMLDRPQDAAPILRDIHERRQRLLPPKHPERSLSFLVMGALSEALGAEIDAEAAYRQAYLMRKEDLPATHPDLLLTRLSWAKSLLALDRIDEAMSLIDGAIEEVRSAEQPDPEGLATALQVTGDLALGRGRFDEAVPLYAEALTVRTESAGSEHPDALATRRILGVALREAGKHDESARELAAVVEALERTRSPDSRIVLEARIEWADALMRSGRTFDARVILTGVRERLLHMSDWRSASNWAKIIQRACAVAEGCESIVQRTGAPSELAEYRDWQAQWLPICDTIGTPGIR